MEISGFEVNAENIQKIFGTGEGRQLIALLNRDGGKALRQAAAALQRGDQAAAAAVLEPIMNQPEAQALVDALNKK
jgi:hypothetical protein